MTSNAKLAVARAVTHPRIGRLVARLTADSIPIRGARIKTASPHIQDSTRAKLALGLYERAELGFVRTHLRPDLDVIELGASIGVVGSVVLGRLKPDRRLIAVEADRELAAIARDNLRANARGVSWALDVAAISYGAQEGLAFVKGSTSTGGRLAQASSVEEDPVERLTLSELRTKHQVDRYALIADIEGAEAGIIADDGSALAHCDQVIIELHDTEDMRVADMRAALVEQHAFSVTAERGPVLVLGR